MRGAWRNGTHRPADCQREAEARTAIAQRERTELLARLPPSSARPLQDSLDAGKASNAGVPLKTADALSDSLKAGETGDRSPRYDAARHLGYAARTEGMPALDSDLQLEGMSTRQTLRLFGVAFL